MTDNQRSMSRASVKWTSRKATTKLICYASPVFTAVYTMPWFIHSTIIPLLFLIHSWCVWQPERLIQLWNPTRIRRSIGTKCHPPITPCSIGLGLVCTIFDEICNHQSRSSSIGTKMPPSHQYSVPLGWSWFVK